MNKKCLLFVLPLMLSVGCSMNEPPPQPVAKVVKPKSPVPPKKPIAKAPQQPPARSVPGTATYAIDDGKNHFKVEPTAPAIQVEPLTPAIERPAEIANPATATSPTAAVAPGTLTQATSPTALNPIPMVTTPGLPPYSVEEARIPNGTQPAVVALLTEADKNRVSGNLDAAVVSLERALRIDSRNPTLTYKLAQLRIKQNKPQLAEELGSKAALLAGNDLDLKRKSWLLIAEARRLQQNYPGAKEAKAKSESFLGH